MTTGNWTSARLGDFIRIKHGYAFKGEFFASTGERVVLTPGNFRAGGGFVHDPADARYYMGDFPAEYVLDKGSLLVAMTDLKQDAPILGAAAFVPQDDRFLHNQRLGKVAVTSPETVDLSFLYYLLNSAAWRTQIRASATGSTVRHNAPERIYRVEVAWPPIQGQRKIASILSAYDDLIENNLRRIKILEEMAQSLYKEWFVDFRFPGHESVRMVDSALGVIPEGWETRSVGEVLEGHIGGGWGSDEPDEKEPQGAHVIRGTDLPEVAHLSIGGVPYRFHGKTNLESRRLAPGDIVMEVSGGGKNVGVGRSLLVSERLLRRFGGSVMCASFCKRMRVRQDHIASLIFSIRLAARYADGALEEYEVQSTGIKNLKFAVFLEQELLALAPRELQREFLDVVEPIIDQVGCLSVQGEVLRQTRDLLLPRLISGELDVSDLDIDIGEDAA
ncbi:MAG: restriction endonuclease subunit S [Armatimonadetes bacterium]|nr:restriction endonuclease subunit S [Armatimonadota bacterium]